MSTDLLEKADTVTAEFDVKALSLALADVFAVVPTRSPKPILQHVLITVEPEGFTRLEATDLEVGVSVRLLGVKADRPFRIVAPPHRLKAILDGAVGRAGAETMTVAVTDRGDGASAVVKGRGFRFELPLEDPALFPAVPAFPDDAGRHDLAAEGLRRLVRRTTFATDVENTRYALGGCLLESGEHSLALVATDGRRLAKQVAAAVREAGGCPDLHGAVVPVKALKLVDRLVSPGDTTAHVTVTGSAVRGGEPRALGFHVRLDRGTVYSRLLEGRFPRYQDVIPAEGSFRTEVRVTAGELLWAFQQASIMTSEESRGVDVAFGAEKTTLKATAADRGSGEVEAQASVSGEDAAVTVDPRYVTDLLKALEPLDGLVVRLAGPSTPVLFALADSGELSYCVMPLSKDR